MLDREISEYKKTTIFPFSFEQVPCYPLVVCEYFDRPASSLYSNHVHFQVVIHLYYGSRYLAKVRLTGLVHKALDIPFSLRKFEIDKEFADLY